MNDKSIKWNPKIKAFILVGGLGTRLRSVVSDVPKPMANIADNPFLFYKINQIKNAGINRIVFCAGYLHETIEEYFGNGKKFGVNIEYSIEKEQLGTAGALKNAISLIETDEFFFVLNGDTYLNIDFKQMWQQIHEKDGDQVMLLAEHHRMGHEGVVVVDDNMKILNFYEKPSIDQIKNFKNSYINAGVYLLSEKIINEIPSNQKCSLEKDIFPRLIGKKNNFYGVEYPKGGYFIDIGVPENYKRFIADIENKRVLFN